MKCYKMKTEMWRRNGVDGGGGEKIYVSCFSKLILVNNIERTGCFYWWIYILTYRRYLNFWLVFVSICAERIYFYHYFLDKYKYIYIKYLCVRDLRSKGQTIKLNRGAFRIVEKSWMFLYHLYFLLKAVTVCFIFHVRFCCFPFDFILCYSIQKHHFPSALLLYW